MAKVLGILGGLGPLATVQFLKYITEMTDASKDQEHLEIRLHSIPAVPDRTSFLNRQGESPLPALEAAARDLENQGVDLIAIPCITCHSFHETLSQCVGVPILNAVEETARYLKARGIRKAGLLATDGTIRTRLFHKALEKQGIDPLVPTDQNMVNTLIYRELKAGRNPNVFLYHALREDLLRQGAEVTVLGCTELSLLENHFPLGPNMLDAAKVLAAQAIQQCAAPLKSSYIELIT